MTHEYSRPKQGDTFNRGGSIGQMGQSLAPVVLSDGELVASLAVGHDFFCAALEGGGVKCWGRNTNGQCGRGDVETYGDDPNEMGAMLPFVDLGTGKKAVSVTAGDAHACALLDDDSIKVGVLVFSIC